MTAKLRSWWWKIKQHSFIAVGIIVVIFIAFTIAAYKFGWDWTGFKSGESQTIRISTSKATTTAEVMQPAKVLWDWFQLLLVPALLSIGAIWFTARHNHDREIAADNQREAALQSYIDKMSELLLHEKLRNTQPEDEVWGIARVRTLTILSRLDPLRKRNIIQFLRESGLIEKGRNIIDLGGANLRGAYLRGAYLRGADLSIVDLREADLSGADLRDVDLRGAKMNDKTDLRETKLQGAIYNTEKIYLPGRPGQQSDYPRQEKVAAIEPTQWPQGFNFRVAKAICVDCVCVSSIVTTPQGPIPIKTEVTASATFTDLGSSDPHKAVWVWGDGTTTPGTVTESNGSSSVSDSHTYTSAGLYNVQITITANDDGTATTQSQIQVV